MHALKQATIATADYDCDCDSGLRLRSLYTHSITYILYNTQAKIVNNYINCNKLYSYIATYCTFYLRSYTLTSCDRFVIMYFAAHKHVSM